MTSPLSRLAASLIVLGLCGWGLWRLPALGPAGTATADELGAEEVQRLQRESRALVAAGKPAEALPLVQRLHEAFPGNDIHLRELAEIQERLGHYEEEAALWERYLKVSPTPWDACPGLGEAYRKLGRTEASIDAFERCLALAPKNPDFLFYLAHAYDRTGRFGDALKVYRRGVAQSPDYPDLQLGLARMEVFVGSPAKALPLAEAVVRRRPGSGEAHLVLGLCLRALDRPEAARAALRRALELDPESRDARAALASLGQRKPR